MSAPYSCVLHLQDFSGAPSAMSIVTRAAARHGTVCRPPATQQKLGLLTLAIFLGSAIESATHTRGAFHRIDGRYHSQQPLRTSNATRSRRCRSPWCVRRQSRR